MAYKFAVDGDEYDTGTLTLDDYVAIEEKSNMSYRFLNPLASAKAAKHIAAHMVAARHNVNHDDALAKVGAINADSYVDGLSFYVPEDDEAPPDPPQAGESSS